MTYSQASYHPLSGSDWPKRDSKLTTLLKSLKAYSKEIALFVFAISTFILSVILLNQDSQPASQKLSYTSHAHSEEWIPYTWWSRYSSADAEKASIIDKAWDAIIPAHGIVAVDRQWAAEKQLPASMNLPSDFSKDVYIIDAYHQIHCLTIVRKTFYQIARREPLTYPAGHSTHCFDSLRQYIMCTAGDTLLYSWGRNITGDGQLRQCKDWAALRNWATENSACYRDSTRPIPITHHFGHCDEGTDGLS